MTRSQLVATYLTPQEAEALERARINERRSRSSQIAAFIRQALLREGYLPASVGAVASVH